MRLMVGPNGGRLRVVAKAVTAGQALLDKRLGDDFWRMQTTSRAAGG